METTPLIVGLGALITSSAAAIVSIITALKQVPGVRRELKTMNELTLGQLGEAEETRRIDKIPYEDRTAQEARHVAMTQRSVEHSKGSMFREDPKNLSKREEKLVQEKLDIATEEDT